MFRQNDSFGLKFSGQSKKWVEIVNRIGYFDKSILGQTTVSKVLESGSFFSGVNSLGAGEVENGQAPKNKMCFDLKPKGVW